MNYSHPRFTEERGLTYNKNSLCVCVWGGALGWLVFNLWLYKCIIKHFHKKSFQDDISSDHQLVCGYMDGLENGESWTILVKHFILMDSRCSVSSLLFGASLQTSRGASVLIPCPLDSWARDEIAQQDPGMLADPGRVVHTPEIRQPCGRAVFESPEPHTCLLSMALKLLWIRRC